MSFNEGPRSLILTNCASSFIPNYEIVREDTKIPFIDGSAEATKLLFLHDSKYEMLQKTMPLPAKRILNIPREKMNNWNNYVVHSMHSDFVESWRENCKVPENWTGPKLNKSF